MTECEHPDALSHKADAELYLDILGHDINNHNQAIVTLLDLLLEDENIQIAIRDDIEMARDQALAISNLIKNLHRLADIKRNHRERIDMDLYTTLQYCLQNLYGGREMKEVHLDHELSEGEVVIKGDDHLEDILANIISNAVKHNRNDKVEITVRHKLEKDQWKLEFIDNGIGIPDSRKDTIFERLNRGDDSIHGAGLGLSILDAVVRSYNGKAWVEDKVQGDYTQGTKFVLLLPRGDDNG